MRVPYFLFFQVNGNDQGSKTEPNDLRLAIIRVNPDEQQYSFTVRNLVIQLLLNICFR